ncbi:MAG: alpha/beta hydrolase [Sedimenticola sp.]
MTKHLTLALLLACTSPLLADPEWPEWADDEERSLAVNEGELHFLETPPSSPAHHHINRITITPRSATDGWVKLHQCHTHLDPVPRAEITYRPDNIRRITLLSADNIGKASVQGPNVLLEEIGSGAKLCLNAETRALHRLPDGSLELRNGPYMRRFLDGYYPMFISLTVTYPEQFSIQAIAPTPRAGFSITKKTGQVKLSGWFEGKLFTRIHFQPASEKDR